MNERVEQWGLWTPRLFVSCQYSPAPWPGASMEGFMSLHHTPHFPEGNCLPGPPLTPPVSTHGPGRAVLPLLSSVSPAQWVSRLSQRIDMHGAGRSLGNGAQGSSPFCSYGDRCPRGSRIVSSAVKTATLRTDPQVCVLSGKPCESERMNLLGWV